MRGLLAAVIVMGVLIALGVAVVVGTIVMRLNGAKGRPAWEALLGEPAGTAIVAASDGPDGILVILHGGGPDRVLLLDSRTGAKRGQVSLGASGGQRALPSALPPGRAALDPHQ